MWAYDFINTQPSMRLKTIPWSMMTAFRLIFYYLQY